MPSLAEIRQARHTIQSAIQYLRGGRDDELHLIEADLLFESGAYHAMAWLLDQPDGVWFARHLAGLRSIEARLVAEARDGQ